MSLASDILRRAAIAPEQYQPSPAVEVKTKPAVTAISNRGLHMARVPCCQRREYGWQVNVCDGDRKHNIGSFQTVTRAIIAWRLWKLWHRRGFSNIPTGHK